MRTRHSVLASSSPARLRVLRDAGLAPEVDVSGVDETTDAPDVASAVSVLAERKASTVAGRPPVPWCSAATRCWTWMARLRASRPRRGRPPICGGACPDGLPRCIPGTA